MLANMLILASALHVRIAKRNCLKYRFEVGWIVPAACSQRID